MCTRRNSLADHAWHCLLLNDTDDKLECVRTMAQAWYEGKLELYFDRPVQELPSPGMPDKLVLVHPSEVQRRRLGTAQGNLALLHAIAHIEFSAINLALDAVYRFQNMPRAYYDDWLRIACEECYHFSLIRHQIKCMDHDYGDLVAHQGLWDVARYSSDDVMQRMALVPRVLEARGLDVTPGMIERVLKVGNQTLADILGIILRDEVGHVATGSYWFKSLCHDRQLDSAHTFNAILRKYKKDMNAHIRGPFHIKARQAAGFSQQELEHLHFMDSGI